MLLPNAIRTLRARRTLVAAALCASAFGAWAQGGSNIPPNQPAPRNYPPQYQQRNVPQQQRPRGGFTGQHLPQWFQQRNNLTPEQRQQDLRREPGFQQMSPENQQRVMERLQKLNSMSPEQRQHEIQRGEVLEHMSPAQRMQWRGAMESYKTLAPDRKRVVARSFRELRELPPSQRAAALNSPQYRSRLSDDERRNLDLILAAEPPMPNRGMAPPPGYPNDQP